MFHRMVGKINKKRKGKRIEISLIQKSLFHEIPPSIRFYKVERFFVLSRQVGKILPLPCQKIFRQMLNGNKLFIINNCVNKHNY